MTRKIQDRATPALVTLALVLGAQSAQAQTTPAAPDPAIGFRIEVADIPRLISHQIPSVAVVGPMELAESCPMPVASTNDSADELAARPAPGREKPLPMPTARPGCRNPLAPRRSSGAVSVH